MKLSTILKNKIVMKPHFRVTGLLYLCPYITKSIAKLALRENWIKSASSDFFSAVEEKHVI